MAEDKKKKKLKGFKEFDPSKVIDLEPRIDEAVMKNTAVITFGRMNPVTVGHEKLATKVASEATRRKGDAHIFLSHSSDKKKNPLSYEDKIRFAQKAFGKIVKTSPARTIIEVAKSLTGKYKNLVVVVGQDRLQHFDTLLNTYNGKEYNFENIEVVSAGARDPDSEGVEGMSASKMRELAQSEDLTAFTSGLPRKLRGNAKEVYSAVRRGMGMNEEVEIDEALNRVQRRKRSIAMRRARFKIRRGKEKAEKKSAPMSVLKRRARKAAIAVLKKRLSKNRKYSDLSSGEKEMIDKRIEKFPKQRLNQIARKLLPQMKKLDRERLAARRSAKKEDLDTRFENFLAEASCKDTKVMKRPHQLLDSNNKVKIDKRFKMYKNKVNESYEDLAEDLATLALDMDRYVDSLDEVTIAATKKAVNVVGPDGRTRTVWKRTRSTQRDDHGQDKIATNENIDLDSFFDLNELNDLQEAPILDKAIAAIHKHVVSGKGLSDIAYDVSRAAGVNMSSRELEKAYIKKHGRPDNSRKANPAVIAKLKSKYGLKSEEKDTHKTKDGRTAKKGLWYNIHQKRKRGEKPAKPGDKDYPKTLDIGEEVINETGGAGDWGTPKLTKRFKKDTPNESEKK